LNPVRAGIVKDPKDYKWCGYAAALRGDEKMLKGLRAALGFTVKNLSNEEMLSGYRVALFGKGAGMKRGDSTAARISDAALRRVTAEGGQLPETEPLLGQSRVGQFTRGLVLGDKKFVDEHLVRYRKETGNRLQSGFRPFGKSSGTDSDLYTMRGTKN
jgi:hypothetical protein